MESNFSQQETQVRDAAGNRWIKCEFCGKIAMESEFSTYGGAGHINLGTCKECSANNPTVKQKDEEQTNIIGTVKYQYSVEHIVKKIKVSAFQCMNLIIFKSFCLCSFIWQPLMYTKFNNRELFCEKRIKKFPK